MIVFRGKGYGHKILKLVEDEVWRNHPEIQRLVAKVKPDNPASNRLFISEGYGLEYSCYTRDITREAIESISNSE